MLRFKVDVMPLLKAAGYNSIRLRGQRLFGEATMMKIRNRKITSMNELARICDLLKCQPGDLIEYVPDEQVDEPPKE